MTDQITPISTNLADRVRQIAEHGNVCPSERHWLEQAAAALSTPPAPTAGPDREAVAGIIRETCGGAMMLLPAQADKAADAILALGKGECQECVKLRDQLHEAETGPWPEWASSLLMILRDYGGASDHEIDLPDELQTWLDGYRDELQRIAPEPTPPTGDAIDRAREALKLAEPIVESDHEQAKDAGDGDWEGMSCTALTAIRKALSALPPAPVDGGGHV